MKKCCEYLRDHTTKIINLKNEGMNKKSPEIIGKCKNMLYL